MLRNKKTSLILIDIQKGFDDEHYWGGNRNNRDCEKKCAFILSKFRELKLPIFHVIHSSKNINSRLHKSNWGFEIKDEVKPLENESVTIKSVNSAFIGTNLKDMLDKQHINTLVIVGFITNHCISTTARMAGNYGYNTFVISDATATFDMVGINGEKYSSELIHLTSLANLNNEFATIVNTKELINRL